MTRTFLQTSDPNFGVDHYKQLPHIYGYDTTEQRSTFEHQTCCLFQRLFLFCDLVSLTDSDPSNRMLFRIDCLCLRLKNNNKVDQLLYLTGKTGQIFKFRLNC